MSIDRVSPDPRALAVSLATAAHEASPALLPAALATDLAAALASELVRDAERTLPPGSAPDPDVPVHDLVTMVLAIDRALGRVQSRLKWEQGGPLSQALLHAWMR